MIHYNSLTAYRDIKSQVERDRHLAKRIYEVFGPQTVRQACDRLIEHDLNSDQALLKYRPRICELKKAGELRVCKSKTLDYKTGKMVMVLEIDQNYQRPVNMVINNGQYEMAGVR
jgi:hypothetical protein